MNPSFNISDAVFSTGVELDAELVAVSGSRVTCKVHLASEVVSVERNGYVLSGNEESAVIATKVYESAGKPKQIIIAGELPPLL